MKARARRARAAGWLVLVAGAVVAAPPAARAQGAPAGAQPATTSAQAAPSGAQLAPAGADAAQASRDADAAFARGKELYRLGKLGAAYEAYRTAWSLKQSYDIAANLANTELQRGMKVEAAEHLAFCLRSFPATGNAAQHEQIRAQFRAVRKEVGSIVVQANVDGAEVSFDGTAMGRTPLRHEVFVKPGTIAVEARLAGHEPARVTLEVPAGETNTANLVLRPPREQPAPPALVPTPGGGGSATGAGVVGPVAGQPAVPVETQPLPEKRSWVPVIALGAASAVGLGVAVGFTVASNDASADVDAYGKAVDDAAGQCKRPTTALAGLCAELHDAGSRQETFGNAARVAFAASGALAIAAVTYALWSRADSRVAAPVHVLPDVSARGAGVTLFSVW
ncbi:PEGA domain-containing protein [Sorangium sp. So ce381]|uniref:PEGA domain-containing protein n=1 Tax=Sorangium sp. So ce381 TaxID=3133307 RepID=UPI003F5B7336